ncbi:MAG: lytic transglycosylase domain-containing protein, partial [Alphaproteobacteria bacterium]|nr:lytic transglycosylase domain-containing protein [Alphaproteobacteria bacterium]
MVFPRARVLFTALLLVLPARADSILGELRSDRWADAQSAVAGYADPVAGKLVAFARMLTPGAAGAGEIADFIGANRDWPWAAQLAKRRDEALAAEPDDAKAADLCNRIHPQAAATLLRCADAYAHTGDAAAATAAARQAWVGGVDDQIGESRFLQHWSSAPTEADQWQRFERLMTADLGAAGRQAARLAAPDRALAEARLALRREAPNAPAQLAALSPAQRADPELFLDLARWLRRAGQPPAALALWKSEGEQAEGKAPAERLAAFWSERDQLARDLLHAGDAAGAYAVAAGHKQQAPEQIADAEFLAGFIALRRLHDPALAARHFAALAEASKSVISNARAHYWLGRAAAARHDDAAARTEYAAAAGWPTTFYGQLAALALGDDPPKLNARILAVREPRWDARQALALIGREATRAALYLVAWGDPLRARIFLMRLEAEAPDEVDRTLAAHLALGLGLPESAVAIARRAGRDGLVLADAGWPMLASVPDDPVPPAVALGVIRQESSFDTGALSPAGARGLMQLMPATAESVAKQIGAPVSLVALTSDAAYNVQLGTAYLHELLDRYGGALPLAIAAYNAGPHRVDDW